MKFKTPNLTDRSRNTFRPQYEVLEDRCVPAMITVNNPGDFIDNDPDTMTLREATEVGRSDRDDDVIMFDMPGNTIYLTSELVVGGYEFNSGQTGKTTIEGQGIVLDAGGTSRVMRIEAGTVHIKGMTMQNGNADLGGAIIAGDGTLARPTVVILDGCMVLNNTARTAGGGIFTSGAVQLINNTLVSGNYARQDGGGVAVYAGKGSLTAIEAVFSNNEAGKTGGAISNNGGTVSVSTSTFSGNHARKGNDIYSNGSVPDVDDDSIDVFIEGTDDSGGGGKGKGGKPK